MNLMLPKTPSFVSPALRGFAQGQECTLQSPWCLGTTDTTVLCHIRLFGMAGMGHKPHDFLAFHGCFECHRHEKEVGWDDILRALMITQARVYQHFGTLTPGRKQ